MMCPACKDIQGLCAFCKEDRDKIDIPNSSSFEQLIAEVTKRPMIQMTVEEAKEHILLLNDLRASRNQLEVQIKGGWSF